MLSVDRLNISWEGANQDQARQLITDLTRCLADLPITSSRQIAQLQIGPLTLSGKEEPAALAQRLASEIALQITPGGGKP